ncbi:fumarylacetoacetate hydrolase family protein [Planctomicrobium sp. SH661]|uniref:fumarylacetoacetate hydrolase family protein n=1 Tax=Planctomicrobium sp. SH661 TaxID=3448124 RepID=UPI003F5C2D86
MKLAKVETADHVLAVAVIEEAEAKILPLNKAPGILSLADLLHASNPAQTASMLLADATSVPLESLKFLAPIDQQEVWAAGVTYKRSQVARMEESESGASHYDKVYSADRPELFFKATPSRVAHPGTPVRVRKDSQWSVPEPELTLVLNPSMEIVGYTIGNDMSARDIEGENPLYLPQAKVYRQCCALGPVILLADQPLPLAETKVKLLIERNGQEMFRGETDLAQLHRKLPDLAGWLGREDRFPEGAFLLTGTGIVPQDNFSLEDGDEISIEITGIGVLRNPVVKDS